MSGSTIKIKTVRVIEAAKNKINSIAAYRDRVNNDVIELEIQKSIKFHNFIKKITLGLIKTKIYNKEEAILSIQSDEWSDYPCITYGRQLDRCERLLTAAYATKDTMMTLSVDDVYTLDIEE